MASELGNKLTQQSPELKNLLENIPEVHNEEQVYFYIWSQDDKLLPVPPVFNTNCVKILIEWLRGDSLDLETKLRPLAFTSAHFGNLFKYNLNCKVAFRDDELKSAEKLTDLSPPVTLSQFLAWIKTKPIYIQYTFSVIYYTHIPNTFFNREIFVEFVNTGPDPPASDEPIQERWKNWLPHIPVIKKPVHDGPDNNTGTFSIAKNKRAVHKIVPSHSGTVTRQSTESKTCKECDVLASKQYELLKLLDEKERKYINIIEKNDNLADKCEELVSECAILTSRNQELVEKLSRTTERAKLNKEMVTDLQNVIQDILERSGIPLDHTEPEPYKSGLQRLETRSNSISPLPPLNTGTHRRTATELHVKTRDISQMLIDIIKHSQDNDSIPRSITDVVYKVLVELYALTSNVWIQGGCDMNPPSNAVTVPRSLFKTTKSRVIRTTQLFTDAVATVFTELLKFGSISKQSAVNLRFTAQACVAKNSGQLWVHVGYGRRVPTGAVKIHI